MKQDPLPDVPVTGNVSRDHWIMPVPGLHPEANGTIELTAHADGTATLRITCDPSQGGHQRIVVLNVTTAAQLSVGVWEAAGVAQQLVGRLGGARHPPPRPSRHTTGSGQPASSLVSAPSPRRNAPRQRPRSNGEEPTPVNEGATVDAEEVAAARTIGWRVLADVKLHRVWLALEAGEPDQAVSITQDIHTSRHPSPSGRAHHWMFTGRALARLRGRHDDAVRALRTAEDIFPVKVRRDPMVRDAIATLLPGARRDAVGMELRGLAHRAGLPV